MESSDDSSMQPDRTKNDASFIIKRTLDLIGTAILVVNWERDTNAALIPVFFAGPQKSGLDRRALAPSVRSPFEHNFEEPLILSSWRLGRGELEFVEWASE